MLRPARLSQPYGRGDSITRTRRSAATNWRCFVLPACKDGMRSADYGSGLNGCNYGFNGAMLFQAWKPTMALPLRIRTTCFNGAMLFQAWKRRPPKPCAIRCSMLQWSHAFSSMETRVCSDVVWFFDICFNGAMLFQAWKRLNLPLMRVKRNWLQWSHAFSSMETLYRAYDGLYIF